MENVFWALSSAYRFANCSWRSASPPMTEKVGDAESPRTKVTDRSGELGRQTGRQVARILVADDDPGVLKLVRLTLELEGFDVVTVTDGPAALEAIRTVSCDLAVLDIMMPMLDGVDVCRAAKADPQTGQMPIILLSAKAQARDIDIGMAAGADLYLTKPFEPLELVESIQGLLQRV